MKEWDADLDDEDLIAYGRDMAARGAVRFKMTTQILRFINRTDMEWKNKQSDDKIIYINRDIVNSFEELTRDRQINKLIRVIIKFEGNTDGETMAKWFFLVMP